MGLLSIVFLGIATNLDNLFIGIAFGARKRNITLLQNVLIASISAITADVACLFAVLISSHFSVYANIAGSIFLLLLGFIGLLKPTPSNSEVSVDRPLHIKETALLGGMEDCRVKILFHKWSLLWGGGTISAPPV